MALSPEQLEARKRFLTASDVASVMGLGRRSPADVWLEKLGELEPAEETDAMRRGNLLEPAILQFAREEIGKEISTNIMVVHPNKLMAANFDGISKNGDFGVEAKSSIAFGAYGEEGTDAVPAEVIIQTQSQMSVWGPAMKLVYVPVLTARLEFRLYIVPRDEDLIADIERAGVAFMRNFVQARVRPTDFKPSLEVLKRVKRTPETLVEVSSDVIDRFLEAKQAAKEAGDYFDECKARLLAEMRTGDAVIDEQMRMVTYFSYNRKGYTVAPSRYRALMVPKSAKELPTTSIAKGGR